MAYFLGRDIKVAISTEQEAFGLKLSSGVLDITGTDATAASDSDPIPPRVYGLKGAGTAGVAEVSRLTIISLTETDFESTSAGSGKYLTLYDPDGDSYVIDFNCSDAGSAFSRTTEGTTATGGYLNIDLATGTGDQSAIALAITNAINADAVFSQAFTAVESFQHVNITNAQTGDATDMLRGTGFTDSEMTVNTAGQTEGVDRSNDLNDVTGLDITIGATDEDIAYLGQRTSLKAEIKKETTISITRKKSDNLFSSLYNSARCGIRHTSGTIDEDIGEADANLALDNNLTKPETTTNGSNFGFRIFCQLKQGEEVMTVMNTCMTDYSTSLNADGVTEETIGFYSNVNPKIQTTPYTTISSQSEF